MEEEAGAPIDESAAVDEEDVSANSDVDDLPPAIPIHSLLLSCSVFIIVALGFALLVLPITIDFSKDVPDTYTCSSGDECNHFDVNVKHLGALKVMVRETYTNLNCNVKNTVAQHERITSQAQIDGKKCARHWKYSKSVHFDRYSKFMNGCINSIHNFSHEQCQCLEDNLRKNKDFTYGKLALFGGLLRIGEFEKYRIGTMSSYNTHKKVYLYAVQNKIFDLCNVTVDLNPKTKSQPQDTHHDDPHTHNHH